MDFSDYLQRLKHLHKEHGKPFQMRDGANPDTLSKLETEARLSLDPHLRQAWLLADGSEHDTPIFARTDFFDSYGFLSSGTVIERLSRQKLHPPIGYADYEYPEPRDPRIKAGWFHERWIPFADFGNGTLSLLQDYDPAPMGTIGQIIAFTHDPDEMTYVAPNFPSFLDMAWEQFADPDFVEAFLDQGFW